MPSQNEDHLILKRTVYAGTKPCEFRDGTKVHFHFQTRLCNAEKTLLDDSRKMNEGKPFELVLGKKFKLEVWEAVVQKMAVNEVAAFKVDKSLVLQYPFVSKTLRDIQRPAEERRSHCCAMTLQTEGIGYDDLNNLLKDPCDLEFIIELVKVEQPDHYEKESWQMSEDEKLKLIPELKETGNREFKKQNYKQASDHYARAIGMLEQLMLKEKPHDEEWNKLDQLKVPLLLNYSQCKLNEGDYYAVIEHCTAAIKTDPENVKAFFRRAKAHVGAWNTKEAIEDFQKAVELDGSLENVVKKELAKIEEMMKDKDLEDKQKLKKMFT